MMQPKDRQPDKPHAVRAEEQIDRALHRLAGAAPDPWLAQRVSRQLEARAQAQLWLKREQRRAQLWQLPRNPGARHGWQLLACMAGAASASALFCLAALPLLQVVPTGLQLVQAASLGALVILAALRWPELHASLTR